MAELAGMPLKATVADTLPLTLVSRRCKVATMQFQKYASGNVVTVTDLNGKLVWDVLGEADLEPVMSPSRMGWINGLIVTALTGTGELLVFLE